MVSKHLNGFSNLTGCEAQTQRSIFSSCRLCCGFVVGLLVPRCAAEGPKHGNPYTPRNPKSPESRAEQIFSMNVCREGVGCREGSTRGVRRGCEVCEGEAGEVKVAMGFGLQRLCSFADLPAVLLKLGELPNKAYVLQGFSA